MAFGWVMSRTPFDVDPSVLYVSDLLWDGPPPPPPCTSDFNDDRQTDGQDLGILLSQFLDVGDLETDLNNSGWVDGSDVAILLQQWGACPE